MTECVEPYRPKEIDKPSWRLASRYPHPDLVHARKAERDGILSVLDAAPLNFSRLDQSRGQVVS